jgi:hypothetical protein
MGPSSGAPGVGADGGWRLAHVEIDAEALVPARRKVLDRRLGVLARAGHVW